MKISYLLHLETDVLILIIYFRGSYIRKWSVK